MTTPKLQYFNVQYIDAYNHRMVNTASVRAANEEEAIAWVRLTCSCKDDHAWIKND